MTSLEHTNQVNGLAPVVHDFGHMFSDLADVTDAIGEVGQLRPVNHDNGRATAKLELCKYGIVVGVRIGN